MYDDTSDDHEQFERRQLARDADRRRSSILDIDSATADELVDDLRDENIVSIDVDDLVFVHEPTGEAFADKTSLVFFHRGWVTAQDEET